jgi:outer membrane protein assembly factor BamB
MKKSLLCRQGAVLVVVAVIGVVSAGALPALAGDGAGIGDWPQFHGPLRDNISTETGLLRQWPAGGRVAALDKATGRTIWANTDIDQVAAYCSPIIIEHNGVRQYVIVMQNQVVSIDVRTGKLLWTHPHATKGDQNVTMPLYAGGKVYVSSGHGTGGMLTGKGFVCVELATGKTAWNEKSLGKVSLTWADGLFYCIDDKAKVTLVEAGPAGCRVVSEFNLPRGKSLTLSHPVVCGKRLYIRHWNDLFAFDITAAGK